MCKYSVDMYVDLYRLTQKVEPIDDLLFFFFQIVSSRDKAWQENGGSHGHGLEHPERTQST